MHEPPRILIVDDNENNRAILAARLTAQGYSTTEACDGVETLEAVRREAPDLILLDVTMPRMDGLEACRRLKSDASLGFVPVILVTARSDSKDVIAGLQAGADEYLTKPVDQSALVARVRSMLRVKELHDRAKQQAAELAAWNDELERRVAEQVIQIERASRLKRFLSPQVADLVLASPTMGAAGKPPARSGGRLLRFARLHGVRGDRRARRGDECSAGVSRGARRADP
jgi:adenylate cyclase